MTSDDVLVLAWLLLGHLAADFLLQTDRVVADKLDSGLRAWRGLAVHGAVVALCLAPVVLAYGVRGLALLVAVTLGHVAVDRWKAVATRRAETRTDAAARRASRARGRGGPGVPADAGRDPEIPEALGAAWTPVPALLFAVDQALHVALIGVSWLALLAREAPTAEWIAIVDGVLGGFPRADFHRAATVVAVLASLLIVNVRAGAFFVATLVRPRDGDGDAPVVTLEPPVTPPPEPALPPTWHLRLGRLVAVAEPSRAAAAPASSGGPASAAPTPVAHASPVRIGAAIGILERLLIVIFVLSGAVAAIGFVVAAKTLARFKQLDDRDFAEYYLLGTLASVTVGLGSALLAQAALSTVTP